MQSQSNYAIFTSPSFITDKNTRARLLLEYEEELSRLTEYVDMYRRRAKTRLLPQDSIDFITTVLDQSEALTGLNRSIVPQEPAFISVYTKTTTAGNPRPILTAYDLKKFHGFRNQVTDLVVIEDIRDIHAVLLYFAENETAEAFAHAAFGLEFGAPYIQTTVTKNGIEYYVISFLFNDEAMKLTSVRETYSFAQKFMEAYPDSSHIKIEVSENNLCQIYLEKQKILATAEAYKNGRPLPYTATSGFALLGNYAFQQEGWHEIPEQMCTPGALTTTLERMQLDMVPTYNRLLKEGLEVLQDDRSFLPQTELEYIREHLDELIWDEIMPTFSSAQQNVEKMYTLITTHKTIDDRMIKEFTHAKDDFEKSRKSFALLRNQFGKIVPRLSSLRSMAVGSEYYQAVKELEKTYSTLAHENHSLKFILELDGFGSKTDLQRLPRIVGFYGLLKIMLTLVSQKAYIAHRGQKIAYLHCRFSPHIINGEGHVKLLCYSIGKELPENVMNAVNNPLQTTVPSRNSIDTAFKHLQEIFCHLYKVQLTHKGRVNQKGIDRVQTLFRIGNLSTRTDDLNQKKGFFMEMSLPAFGRLDEFKHR